MNFSKQYSTNRKIKVFKIGYLNAVISETQIPLYQRFSIEFKFNPTFTEKGHFFSNIIAWLTNLHVSFYAGY